MDFTGHAFPTLVHGEAGEATPPAGWRPDPAAVSWRLRCHEYDGENADSDYASYFARFLETVDTTRIRDLTIGSWGDPVNDSSATAVKLLADAADRFPALRSLFLGDISYEDSELSWIEQSDVAPLLQAFPELTALRIRGGTKLGLKKVRHASLRTLRIESAGLRSHVVRTVGACELPALEHLELWLGVETQGGSATAADLAPILGGERLPSLRHLGLRNSEIQDEIAAAVASAPVVARLESLDLSMGALTDAGAEALLSGQPLTHLKELDLHHHYLTDAMMDRLRAALPGVDVDLSDGEDPDDDWPYVAASE
ncbi:leucine-rich repeat domain-containing protein [Actinomadura craniellae]|uniref:Leucine-rich repeat domain-containing protein n=1 Tax=Actinomadura craniellae TaxID=2231787 RepID=A0A365GVV8_9ACTN|nr:leucine-rich repeat domain-containing protein [Actinomadura craniellae]